MLLDFVATITKHAYRVTDEQVQGLGEVGWTDEQIAETVYDAALFNLFVRLADTFGIEPPAMYEPTGFPQPLRRNQVCEVVVDHEVVQVAALHATETPALRVGLRLLRDHLARSVSGDQRGCAMQ